MLRILWILICGLLLWFSIFIIGKSSSQQFGNWYAAKSWVQTKAELTDLRLNQETKTVSRSSGGSYEQTYYDVIVRYQYNVDGRKYSNTRLSFASTIDTSVSGYHNTMYAQLKPKQQALVIWYDPNQPQNAVIDRNLRIDTIMFAFVFMFFTGGIGLIGLYFSARTLIGGHSSETSSAAAFGYSVLILLIGFCFMAILVAISSVKTGDYKGLAALIFPTLIVPPIIGFYRYSKRKKNEK